MFTTLVCALLATAQAKGSDWREPWYEKDVQEGSVTFSLSPLRLLEERTFDLGAELRVGPTSSFGVSATPNLAGRRRGPLEVGLQLREYVVGDFDSGLALGAQGRLVDPDIFRMRADSTSFGPFLAAKVTLAIFTFEARGGPEVTLRNNNNPPDLSTGPRVGPRGARRLDPPGIGGLELAPRVDLRAGLTF